MVIDSIIIKKGINYLLSGGKSTAKSVYYLHSRSVNHRRHFLKLTLKFRYGTFSRIHPLNTVSIYTLFSFFLFINVIVIIIIIIGRCDITEQCWKFYFTVDV